MQDLLEALKPKLDEDLHDGVESLLMDSTDYDVKCLHDATKVRRLIAKSSFYQEKLVQ